MLLKNDFEPIFLVAARTNWRFKIGISRGSSAVSRVQSYFRKFGNSARKAKANMELFIRSLFQFQVTHSNKFLHRYSGPNQFDWPAILDDHTKGQVMSKCIDKIIDFPKYHRKKLIDFCPESLFRLKNIQDISLVFRNFVFTSSFVLFCV